MQENGIKKAVREGRLSIGTMMSELGTPGIAQLLQYTGLDWVMIDMESSLFSIDQVAALIAWFKATPITVLVRPPANFPHLLQRVMDIGAMGVHVGHVETAEAARAIVDGVMYPPLGNRGVEMVSAHTDWAQPKAAEYMPLRNAQTSVVAMIESVEGLGNVDAIAAVEGVDIVHASRNDLSVALGIPQQYDHPKYKEALIKISDACNRHGKAFKFNPHNEATIEEFYKRGCRIMGTKTPALTSVLQNAMKSEVQQLRAQVAKL
jgi:2-keto-3-deoxy-L-rhamnonate aldolase RhmA